MASEDAPNGPKPTVAPLSNAPEPDERRNLGTERRITHDTWEAMYQAWKAGERSPKHLGIKFNVSEDSAHRYIHRGVKSRGWPSFFVRQADENTAVQEAKLEATRRMTEVMVDEFTKVQKESLDLLSLFRRICGGQVKMMINVLREMRLTKQGIVWKVVIDKDGNPQQFRETVERPLDATEVASLSKAISGAIATASRMESFWLGGPTDPDKTIPESAVLSPAELEYMEKTGAFPPGVSPETFIGKMAATFGIKLPGVGSN